MSDTHTDTAAQSWAAGIAAGLAAKWAGETNDAPAEDEKPAP